MSFLTTVQQYDDSEDLYIEIPEQIIEELGWEVGDTLNWDIEKGNTIVLTKVQDTEESQGQSNQTHERNSTKDFIKTKGKWI